MEEKELIEIEDRITGYPTEARHDILLLTREIRRLFELSKGKKSQQSTAHLFDSLTGLLNAGAYGVRFAMARARATRFRKIFAVMSVDIAPPPVAAKSKRSGRGTRELIIKQIAERLEACVRATDTLARIGDENFAIILEDLTEQGQAERVKQQLQEAIGEIRGGERDAGAPDVDIRIQFYPGPHQPPGAVAYHS